MNIITDKFGELDLNDSDLITFPRGIVGFRGERAFVLLRKTPDSPVGWLQSVSTPGLALPVVSVDTLAAEIPIECLEIAIAQAKIATDIDHCAIMAVVCAPGGDRRATVNLLAPIIVNATTRRGAQVIVENTKLSTQEPFILGAAARRQANASRESSQVAASMTL